MMNHFLANMLVHVFRLVKSTGVLKTEAGWRGYAAAYRLYKNVLDRDFKALRRFVQKGSSVIDVGANVGVVSLAFSRWVGPSGRVLAIEPEKRNVQALQRAVESSEFGSNVTILQKVAADAPGQLYLDINEANPGDHRLSPRGIQVAAITLDQIINDLGWSNISLIKIDVQGAEPLVLRGAERILQTIKPPFFIEIFDQGLRGFDSSANELIRFMELYGYRPHLITRKGITPVTRHQVLKECAGSYTDVLFLYHAEDSSKKEIS
jgi:FkbM family methyltransferase